MAAKLFIAVLFICSGLLAEGQMIDHTSTYRNINQKKYFRILYDNDFFRNIDLYYTQGLVFEWVKPSFAKFPLTRFLFKTSKSEPRYGFALDHWGYTPDNASLETPAPGDRPYAACLTLTLFGISPDSIRKTRLASAISVGVLGPAAGGKELQTAIHNLINDVLPKGWNSQVRNNIIVNYRLNFEKQLLTVPERILLNLATEARMGTLDDRLSAGMNMMAGHFKDPFGPATGFKKKIQYFFYSEAKIHFVAYNASLQGGFFDKRSPFTIASRDISRITFQWDAGIAIHLRKLFFHFSQSCISREFHHAKSHKWGGLGFGWRI